MYIVKSGLLCIICYINNSDISTFIPDFRIRIKPI